MFTSYFVAVAGIGSGWSDVGPVFPTKCKLQIYVSFFTDSAVNICRQHALAHRAQCSGSLFLWKTNEKHVFHFSPIWISRITVTSPITTVLCVPLFKKICHNNNWLTPLQMYNVCPKLIWLLCDAWWVNLFLAVRLNYRSVLN